MKSSSEFVQTNTALASSQRGLACFEERQRHKRERETKSNLGEWMCNDCIHGETILAAFTSKQLGMLRCGDGHNQTHNISLFVGLDLFSFNSIDRNRLWCSENCQVRSVRIAKAGKNIEPCSPVMTPRLHKHNSSLSLSINLPNVYLQAGHIDLWEEQQNR